MGRSSKRKARGSSEGNTDNNSGGRKKKAIAERGPSRGSKDSEETVTVSEVLNLTNSILYDESNESFNSDTVFTTDSLSKEVKKLSGGCERVGLSRAENTEMASGGTVTSDDPTNADIMMYLKKIDNKLSSMQNKIGAMDKRLSALEEMKAKVDGFDGEMKKLWGVIEKQNKKTEERLNAIEDKTETVDFDVAQWNSKVSVLQKEKDALKDEVVYLQSQSMRNNLVFSNIPESASNTETNEDCEKKLRNFLEDKMKIAKDTVDKIKLERVHRMGQKVAGKHRSIVAKFHDFKEREMVRKQWKTLEGTAYHVSEQFPREIVEKRKKLVPRMRAARADNKRAWIAYDTLYIDGKAVRD